MSSLLSGTIFKWIRFCCVGRALQELDTVHFKNGKIVQEQVCVLVDGSKISSKSKINNFEIFSSHSTHFEALFEIKFKNIDTNKHVFFNFRTLFMKRDDADAATK